MPPARDNTFEQDDPDYAPTGSHHGDAPGFGPPAEPGEVGTLGPYRILKELGKGGMGAVYLAVDSRLNRRVALKVMLPQYAANRVAKERFLREARAAAQVEHDNVVAVFEADERDRVPYIAMPFLQGHPLDDYLKKKGELTVPQVVRVGKEAAAGLAAAHALGLVHRDIKPANIWLEAPSGRVKILDFGLARQAEGGGELTNSGAVVGTPAYMSPEQARGEKLDARSDLFSLGAMLYRLATRKMPFPGANVMAILTALATDTPAPVRALNPDVPPPLADLIDRLLAKKPDARPQTAQEVADALAGMERGLAAGDLSTPNPVPVAAAVPQVVYVPIAVSEQSGLSEFADLGATEPDPDAAAPRPAPRPPAKGGGAAVLALGGLAAVTVFGAGGLFLLMRGKPAPPPDTGPELAAAPTKPRSKTTKVTAPEPTTKVPDPALPPAGNPPPGDPAFTNGVGMEFVNVPKGKAWLGGGGGKPGDQEVVIPADFQLGRYEVTQGQWEAVMGNNPSAFTRTGAQKELVLNTPDDLSRYPVETVSWDDGQKFLAKLNDLEKGRGWVYRLPTAAEWEYACRGGPMTDLRGSAFHFYLDDPADQVPPGSIACTDGGRPRRPRTVGAYKPNRLGLYDMHGSVWEWCQDKAPGGYVLRGGAFGYPSSGCTASTTITTGGATHYPDHGLRVVRTPVVADPAAVKEVLDWVVKNGRWDIIEVDDGTRVTRLRNGLPAGPFRVVGLNLDGSYFNPDRKDIGDYGRIAACTDLRTLSLSGQPITDAEFAKLAPLTGLRTLYINGTSKLTPAAAATLRAFPALEVVRLPVAEDWAKAVADLDHPALREVQVGKTPNLPGVIDRLLAAPRVTRLKLDSVPAESRERLKAAKHLRLVELDRGPNPEAAVKALADAMPWCEFRLRDAAGPGGNNVTVFNPGRAAGGDRELAAWVIANGGEVTVNDGAVVSPGNALPDGDLRLTGVQLSAAGRTPEALAAGLAPAAGCGHLRELYLSNLPGDAGLDHFRGCTALTVLRLDGAVSQTGLYHFRGCKNLERLDLSAAGANTAALSIFSGCKKLKVLQLIGVSANDTGLGHFADNPGLEQLAVRSARNVTGPGLAAFAKCQNLKRLDLHETPITDAGLAHFKGCTKLEGINLSGDGVTGASVPLLSGFQNLTHLDLRGTKLTAAEIGWVAAALPGCKIEHDGGTIGPKAAAGDADRKAAEWVLAVGGYVEVGTPQVKIKAAADLPQAPFPLKLARLDGAKVTDADLARFDGVTALVALWLPGTGVTDLGAERLGTFNQLTFLWLQQTPLSDTGLAHLHNLKRLGALGLRGTKVTAKGVEAFHAAVPGCKIEWDGGVIVPKAK